MNHENIQWSNISNGQDLNDDQKSWDDWFRSAIPAVGDSSLQKISTGSRFGAAQYLDTTNGGN